MGGGAGFIGLTFRADSIHHWLENLERNVALVLVPIGLTSILVGSARLVATTAIYILGRKHVSLTKLARMRLGWGFSHAAAMSRGPLSSGVFSRFFRAVQALST